MQFAGRLRKPVLPKVLELLRLKIEDRPLVVGLRRREVQRVAQPGVDGEARRHLEIVLREEFEDTGARVNDVLLQVDREVADLTEQVARQGVSGLSGKHAARGRVTRLGADGVCSPARIAEGSGEIEDARGRRRLQNVQPLNPVIDAEFHRVPRVLPSHRVKDLYYVRV